MPDESHDASEEEEELSDRPSLHRQQEDTQTEELQSTLQDGASANLGGPPELDVSGIPNKKTWPDPHFCQKCGWVGQGTLRIKLKINLKNKNNVYRHQGWPHLSCQILYEDRELSTS